MELATTLAVIPDWIEAISLVLMGLTFVATAVARLTPTKSDDEKLARFSSGVLRVVSFLPTLGVNPRTKKMEEALKEIQETK